MPEHSFKKLFLCLALICGSSGLMQVLVFSKRQDLHRRHHADSRLSQGAENSRPAAAPVEGTLSAIGSDRIHINNGSGSLATFRCDSPGQYQVGQKLRITYAQGDPPRVLKVELLQP
jgi:hypothetical protein